MQGWECDRNDMMLMPAKKLTHSLEDHHRFVGIIAEEVVSKSPADLQEGPCHPNPPS